MGGKGGIRMNLFADLSAYQIILKTIATTIDLLIAVTIIVKGGCKETKAAYTVFCFLNLVGIWG